MKASKKLITASFALVAALAVSVGTTYAWFTQQSFVEVSDINASIVKADTDLQIRQVDKDGNPVKGHDFTYDLQLVLDGDKTFPGTTNVNDTNFKLNALTSEDKGETLYTRDEYDGDKENEAQTGYIVFYLQFRSSEAVDVVLADGTKDADAASVTSGGGANGDVYAWDDLQTKYSDKAINFKDPLVTDSANAARLAFLAGSATALKPTTGFTKNVWNPQATAEEPTGFPKGNLAHDYEEQLKGESFVGYTGVGDEGDDNDVELGETPLLRTAQVTDSADGAGYYGYLTVKIWIEGRDGDCFNYILGDILSVALNFEALKVNTGAVGG